MVRIDVQYPDFGEFENNIGASGNVTYLNKEKLERLLKESELRELSCKYIMNRNLSMLDGGALREGTSKDAVRRMFVNAGVPESMFKKKGTKSGLSFDKERQDIVADYLSKKSFDNDMFFNMHMYMQLMPESTFYNSIVSSMKKNIKTGLVSSCEMKGYNGIPLLEMYNIYERQITGRYYSRQANIVALPAMVRKCMTVPDGYLILGFDMRQADIRILYNVHLRGYYPEDDELFDNEKQDKYKAVMNIICNHTNYPFSEEEFMANRAGNKTGILSGAYFAGAPTISQHMKQGALGSATRSYFDNHPGYQALISKLKNIYELGVPFRVKDYFGFEIDIDMQDQETENYDYSNEKISFEEMVKLVVSRTTQSTTNSILINWTNKNIQTARDNGISEALFQVCQDRHDEIDFFVHSSVLEKLDFLFDSLDMRIDDWDVMSFETEVYIHYEEDEEGIQEWEEPLLNKYKEIVNNYLNKQYKVVDKQKRKPIRCVPNVHEIFTFSVLTPVELCKVLTRPINGLVPETTEEALNIIDYECEKGNIQKIFESYRDTYDVFVIRNSNSGQMRKFKGIDNLESVLSQLNIEYVKANTLFDTGLTLMGITTVKPDRTAMNDTKNIITTKLDSIKDGFDEFKNNGN